jgi:hypothetical protein
LESRCLECSRAGGEAFLEFVYLGLERVFVNWLFVWLCGKPVVGFLELLVGGFSLVELELEFACFRGEVCNELLDLRKDGFEDRVSSRFILGALDPIPKAVEVFEVLKGLGEFLFEALFIEGSYVFLVW